MREEKYNTRDRVYSWWHRSSLPDFCDAIDLDLLEVCHNTSCRLPLALMETARDVGQTSKNHYITKQIAELLKIHGYVVLYQRECSDMGRLKIIEQTIQELENEKKSITELGKLRVQRIDGRINAPFVNYTPDEWGKVLIGIHKSHSLIGHFPPTCNPE